MAHATASAKRYAEAVFSIAAESGSLVAWSGDLRTVADFAGEADVARLLASARMPRAEKLRLLQAGLAGQVSPLAMNLVRLLTERGKLGLARQIQAAFQEMADARAGIAHATVTTAVPLSDEERAAVAAKLSELSGKRVDVTPVVDPAIIGGIIARIGDELIDASTRTRLVALKRRIEAGAGARG